MMGVMRAQEGNRGGRVMIVGVKSVVVVVHVYTVKKKGFSVTHAFAV